MSDEDLTPADPPPTASTDGPVRLTKAEKLEAKAARLREAEIARAQAAALASESPSSSSGVAGGLSSLQQIIVGSTLVAIIAVLVVLTFLERGRVDDRDSQVHKLQQQAAQESALRSSATKAAVTVSESFGTYDYKTLAADFARTRAYLTPSFASDFSKLTSSLGTLITQDKGQTVGTVQGVGVTSVTAKKAVVIVFLDQKVTTSQSSTPRLDHNRLRLTMARQTDGTWLVSKLELI